MAGVVSIFKALSNPNRLIVYQIICRKGVKGQGTTIEQICAAAKMKQPAVSHHVARLAAAGLVDRQKAQWGGPWSSPPRDAPRLAAAGLVDRKKSQWWVHCSPSSEALDLMRRFSKDPAEFPDGD